MKSLNIFKKKSITVCVLSALPVMTFAKNTENLQQLDSDTMGILVDAHEQTDSSRIYLDEGAIWASRDITKFNPVLDLSVSDEAEIENGALVNALNFSVNTNYSYYIKTWQLEVYRGADRHLSEPLIVKKGDVLANSTDIEWDGSTEVDYQFRLGEQLLFRLKVWDKDGNMDVTSLGVIDLVRSNKDLSIDKNINDEDSGRHFGKSRLMRHNIPTSSGLAKFIGTGLDGVDKVIIGEDEFDVVEGDLYAEIFLPTDAYRFPTTVVFDSGEERRFSLYARIPDTYYAQAGLADFYVGANRVGGSTGALEVNEQYAQDIYNQGRIAYFGQGKFGDKLRVVAHVDTKDSAVKDMFKNPFAANDASTVFDIVDGDDEMMYGNYGDGANIQKVVNTKGKVYLDVQYDKSQYLWGNFNTGITGTDNGDYNRSLYGFKGDYRTRETTLYGEDRLNIVGFASQADSLYSHDEFLGTGGSLYFLQHGEVLPGSDKVMIKVMNKDSGIVEREIPLQSGRDYEIDEYQGRIILTRPLSDIVSDSFGSVIDDSPRGGYENYLSVDYEYVPRGKDAQDAMAYGGRVKGWINDYIGVGATYITEEKDSQDYELYSTDLTLRATEGTYLKTEFGHTTGTQVDSNFVSFDGGLTFTPITSGNVNDREGNNIQVLGVASLYDLAPGLFGAVGNDVKAWYKSKDAGYSYASQSDDLEQESYGTEVRLQVGDRVQVSTRFTSMEEKELDGTLETDSEQIELETQFLVTEHVKISLAGKHVKELNRQKESGTGSLAGAKAEYLWDSENSIYVKAQTTVDATDSYDDNDSVTVGAETRILEDLTLGGAYTTGSRGDAAEATVNYDVTKDYSTYVTYVEDNYQDQNNVILGQRAALTQTVDFYQENQFVNENNGKGRIDSFGFDNEFTDDIDLGIAYQQGEIEYNNDPNNTLTGLVHRKAISFSISFDLDDVLLKNKFEYRVDETEETNEKIEQWVTTNSYTHHLTEEYTLFGKFNYSRSENETNSELLERFIESSIGLAYRPIYNDRLNLLARYTYLVDFDNINRDVEYSDEESHIIETEAIYSWNAHWDFGAKYAYKDKYERFDRASGAGIDVNSQIYLTGISASYRIMKNWDVTGQYHWKVDTQYDEMEDGALISFNKHLTDNFKMGVGYNFSRFDDNLTNDDDYDASGVFINLIGKI
ncbi:hypothetical protein [Aliivibrio fischeri]|uniref:Uncharacterized protein n=1 Tax=Aliivibrio fischeri SR5 TaxID=1088719 RepID=A0AAV3ENU1_ALIFS|nr:hypothetical protein [Aliivibrio fischeri]EHN68625.1 hypothetical protein VFSR5_A0523 [Aliivibrio fischeri SR5]